MSMPAPPPLSALQRIRRSIRPLLTLVFLGGGGGLLLGLVLFTAHRQGAFERQLQIRLVVPDASGLHPGSRVTLSGVQVGALRQLDVQRDGRVLLRFTVPERYRGVVSPASVVSIGQDVLMGDRHLQVQAAPAPPASVPDRFQVRFGRADSLEDLLRQASGSLRRLDALLLTAGRFSDAELRPGLQQLRRSLQRADAVSSTLVRELPPRLPRCGAPAARRCWPPASWCAPCGSCGRSSGRRCRGWTCRLRRRRSCCSGSIS